MTPCRSGEPARKKRSLTLGTPYCCPARRRATTGDHLGLHPSLLADTDRRELDKQMQQRRNRYVARQISNHRGRRRG